MKNDFDRLKDVIVRLVSGSNQKRLRPHEIDNFLSGKLGGSNYTVQSAINDLVREGELVFTYRDPWSYLEVPGAIVAPAIEGALRNRYEQLKDDIVTMVSDAENRRLRPHDIEQSLSPSQGGSKFTVQQALNDLVREGKLVFSYRDPWSYVEQPGLGAYAEQA